MQTACLSQNENLTERPPESEPLKFVFSRMLIYVNVHYDVCSAIIGLVNIMIGGLLNGPSGYLLFCTFVIPKPCCPSQSEGNMTVEGSYSVF